MTLPLKLCVTVIGIVAAAVASGQSPLFHETGHLVAIDTEYADYWGNAIDISGDRCVIAASNANPSGDNSGLVRVYSLTSLARTMVLTSADISEYEYLGESVAISGSTVVAGAPLNDFSGQGSGTAFLFDADTGEQLHRLVAPTIGSSNEFGGSVDICGDRVVVGARKAIGNMHRSGAAFVFDVTTGELLHRLYDESGRAGDNFGSAVSIDGDRIVVGAPSHDGDFLRGTGATYVFDAATGALLRELVPRDAIEYAYFGSTAAISGRHAVIGAYGEGVCYVFDVETGEQHSRLLQPPGDGVGGFGRPVAIDGAVAVVGARLTDVSGDDSGTAYLYGITNGQLIGTLRPREQWPGDWFGWGLAVQGGTVVVGAIGHDKVSQQGGLAFVFEPFGSPCNAADLALDYGLLDLADIVGFIEAFMDEDPRVDLNGDGLLDLSDVTAFTVSFAQGCKP